MTAENIESEKRRAESVDEIASTFFDPKTASDREVVEHFLEYSLEHKDSDAVSRYVATILSFSGVQSGSELDERMHSRLQQIIRESNISDETWEDSDAIAIEIYHQLRVTKSNSVELADQRKALYKLLLLRGADVKLSVAEDDHVNRWDALVRKIGSRALR